MNTGRNVCLAVVLAGMMLTPTHLPSCGPMFQQALFSYQSYPAAIENGFLDGRLGVLQPTFWRKFLLVAHRYMNGKPLTSLEKTALEPAATTDGTKRWLQAREKATGTSNARQWVPTERRYAQYQSYINCGNDAWITAAATLEDRARRFGTASPGVKSWIAAQDAVFANCGEGTTIPAEPEPGLEPMLAADRRYQIAAAHFYAESFDEARRRFQEIGRESDSPWRAMAPYLAARCLLRKATLKAPEQSFDRPLLQQAHDELAAMPFPPARKLTGYATIRLQPVETLRRLTAALSDPANDGAFQQNLIDFQFLMDSAAVTDAVAREAGDLTHWIRVFQSSAPDSLHAAVSEWKRAKSAHWLVAVLSKTNARHPDAQEFLEAAAQVKPDAPAFATLTYHSFRLLIELGQHDAARKAIDALLASPPPSLTLSTVNLLKAQRLPLAQNFEEFLSFSPRTPIGVFNFDERDAGKPESAAPRLDLDSALVFNHGLPLSLLRRAAASPKLPVTVRKNLLLATWTRAVLLDNHRVALELAPQLPTNPYVQSFRASNDLEDRRFHAANLMLHFSESTPFVKSGMYPFRWWCAAEPEELPKPPAFLTASERAQFDLEFSRMQARPNGPTFLGRIVIDWVRRHPDSPLAPEALHFTVRATRFGCHHATGRAVSREAFQLLHRRWPKSTWAQKTPYYF